MATIRTSERISFKKCRRLWEYSSQNRRALEPVQLHNNLSFGIAVHVGLEHYYHPDNFNSLDKQSLTELAVVKFKDTINEQVSEEKKANLGNISIEREAEVAELLEKGEGMLRHYGEWAPTRDKELGLEPLAVEEAFKVPIGEVNGEPVYYQARLDMVARHKGGSVWIWDHKTAATVGGDHTFLDLDTQISSYIWLYYKKYDILPKGVMYNELAKKVPKPPKQLKSGALSTDKRQNTTLDLYVKEIDRLGLDSGPYDGMLEYLAHKEQDFFLRTPVTRTMGELIAEEKYVKGEVIDMLYDPSIYPNPSKMHCNNCDFRAPCTVENSGHDADFLLDDRSLFRKRVSEDVPVG